MSDGTRELAQCIKFCHILDAHVRIYMSPWALQESSATQVVPRVMHRHSRIPKKLLQSQEDLVVGIMAADLQDVGQFLHLPD